MIYSGWKFILFLVFGGRTSNFICLTFSILRSSSLWRIASIFLSLDKAVYGLGTTSPSSRNLAPVGEEEFSRDFRLQVVYNKSIQVTILIKVTEEYEAESAFLKNKNFFWLLLGSHK